MESPQNIIDLIKEKAVTYAKTHATDAAKNFYILGKRDAASIFLAMVKENGLDAIEDVAREVLKSDPKHENATWILQNNCWRK